MKAKQMIKAVSGIMAVLALNVCPALALPLHQPMDFREIAGAPLRIQVGSNASIQVFHEKYPNTGATYGSGDSGFFIAIERDVYGPNLPDTNQISASCPTYPIDLVSHDGPSGTGTVEDPLRIVTAQRLRGSDADLTVVQTVSYVNGDNYFQLDWKITNNGGRQTDFKFYHAADLFFAGTDEGRGYYNEGTGSVGGYNEARDWFMVFSPLTPADHYKESDYFWEIWDHISAARDFDDKVADSYGDNGAGLQWEVSLQAGETTTISDQWRFGEREEDVLTPRPAPQPGPVDVWVKDSPQDVGDVPSTESNAAFWISPDITNRNQDDDSKEHENPISGQTNYLHVQVRNRGEEPAEQVVVKAYLADANVIAPWGPDSWTLIGSAVVENLGAGEVVWTEAVEWDPPFTGHGCVLVRLESEQDPITADWNVPQDNNIAQLNVHILGLTSEEVSDHTGSGSAEAIVVGPAGTDHRVDLIVQYPDPPPSLRIYVVMPPDLFERWRDAGGTLTGGEIEGDRILATGPNETVIGGLPLEEGEEASIKLEIEGPTNRPFQIGAVEEVNGQPMGGNLYIYKGVPPTPIPTQTSVPPTPAPTPTPTPTPRCPSHWWPPGCWRWWLWLAVILGVLFIVGLLSSNEE